MAETHNPFKMIGPYIGAAIGIAPALINLATTGLPDLTQLANDTGTSLFFIKFALITINVGAMIWGFFIGWGIQELIRLVRRHLK